MSRKMQNAVDMQSMVEARPTSPIVHASGHIWFISGHRLGKAGFAGKQDEHDGLKPEEAGSQPLPIVRYWHQIIFFFCRPVLHLARRVSDHPQNFMLSNKTLAHGLLL